MWNLVWWFRLQTFLFITTDHYIIELYKQIFKGMKVPRTLPETLYSHGTVLFVALQCNVTVTWTQLVACFAHLNLQCPDGQRKLCWVKRWRVSKDPRWNRSSHMWQQYVGASSPLWHLNSMCANCEHWTPFSGLFDRVGNGKNQSLTLSILHLKTMD
jgi:hypothetical protein